MVSEVLSLYRSILRRGRLQLKFTDQGYFRRLVREEFERNRHEQNPIEIKFQIEVHEKLDNIISLVINTYLCFVSHPI